jgi:hypothetical protein
MRHANDGGQARAQHGEFMITLTTLLHTYPASYDPTCSAVRTWAAKAHAFLAETSAAANAPRLGLYTPPDVPAGPPPAATSPAAGAAARPAGHDAWAAAIADQLAE